MAEGRERHAARRLTPTEWRILLYISEHEGRSCSKNEMDEALGRNRKTIDRLVTHLRAEGIIESEPVWGKNGVQLGNAYRLTYQLGSARTQ